MLAMYKKVFSVKHPNVLVSILTLYNYYNKSTLLYKKAHTLYNTILKDYLTTYTCYYYCLQMLLF